MTNNSLYRVLVPNAPQFKRTEGDQYPEIKILSRIKSAKFVDTKEMLGLQKPKLTSSYSGSIERLLFSFPNWATTEIALTSAYQSLIKSLRVGTKFIVVHHTSVKTTIENWFNQSGHQGNVTYVPVADYVSLTDWAEDAYVSLKDEANDTSYLMEPWEFKRAGDALIADAVEGFTDVKASQSPLIFQGGNCLVGGNFWFLGKDYFADTIDLLDENKRPPVKKPDGTSVEDFAKKLFTEYVDNSRKLILIGTKKPIPLRSYIGTKTGQEFYIDIASGGAGTFQPIFHIDMFITLIGENEQGKFELFVGSPKLANELLNTQSPFALDDVYDTIAKNLSDLGYLVHRNPIVHRPTIGESFKLSKLIEIASQPEYQSLLPAIEELKALGANDNSIVKIRDWHHITWNNCLVENSTKVGKNVYLPTFGYNEFSDLKIIDDRMKTLWEQQGFIVNLLGDFNEFAKRQGVVHCIKKYINRGA
jgi:hypothetical protein